MVVAIETRQRETPKLEFSQYAIAFHFAAEWKSEQLPGSSRDREPMASYERDMLQHAHRDEPPFSTRVDSLPWAGLKVHVHFPADVVFESELRLIRLQGEAHRRTFDVSTSATVFERSSSSGTRIVVLNLALASGEESPPLNEYDVIKLIKLWEGGEGLSDSEWGKVIRLETPDGVARTLEQTAGELFREWLQLRDAECDGAGRLRARIRRGSGEHVAPASLFARRVGTVELQLSGTEGREQLFRDLAALKEEGTAPDNEFESERWDRVTAVGGILQGLLDFRFITSGELADVFAEVDVDSDEKSLLGFHKGTLLSLSGESEPDPEPGPDPDEEERPSPIAVDPYVAIPNVVLLHNEQRLIAARKHALHLSLGQPGSSVSGRPRVNIDDTADGLNLITGLLAQHLPNVFHYRGERQLYEVGGRSRGLDDLATLIERRREELTSTLQRRQRRRDTWTAVIGVVSAIVIGVFAAVQNLLVQEAIETLDWWILLLAGAFLYLAFRRLRNRVF